MKTITVKTEGVSEFYKQYSLEKNSRCTDRDFDSSIAIKKGSIDVGDKVEFINETTEHLTKFELIITTTYECREYDDVISKLFPIDYDVKVIK